jgi:hypothetical protein
MENSNQPTPINEETVMSNIQSIFQAFVEAGGEPKVTSFKRHLDKLINAEIKPLCGRSGKTADGADWRSEVKAKFGGRGAKWVFVSLDSIRPTLSRFAEQGIDVEDYSKFIEAHGQAWVRFSGPRIDNGVKAAAFEVRTDGSTIDHPKQLHYIPLHDLDEAINFMNSTPHAMKLEEVAKPQEVEAPVEVEDVEAQMSDEDELDTRTELGQEVYGDAMDNLDELMDFEEMDL